MYVLFSIVCVLLGFTLYQCITSVLTKRRAPAKTRNLGCKPPPLATNKLPFGIDQIRRALKADAEKRFPDLLVERVSEMGAPTFQTNLIGSEILFTAEPRNIQALLATQFSDFCLGEVRRGTSHCWETESSLRTGRTGKRILSHGFLIIVPFSG